MDNLDIINQYHDIIWTNKNTEAVFDLFGDQAKIHSPLRSVVGASELKSVLDTWLTAFPDLTVEWNNLLTCDDKVLAYWESTGTHDNTFLDIPATGKKVKYQGISLYEFDGDKVKEYWCILDLEDVKKQLTA